MALQKESTIKGMSYPQSYWKLVQRNINDIAAGGQIAFNGYGSKDARMENVDGNALDQCAIPITPDIYEQFDGNIGKAEAYQIAKEYKVGYPPLDGKPDNRPLYFEGAVDV